MTDSTYGKPPSACVELLIYCTPEVAFAAFVEPTILEKFWLAKASAPLGAGARVRWNFLVCGASAEVEVKEWEPARRIHTAWDDGTTIEWRFTPHAGGGTVVTITQTGFKGDAAAAIASALDATQGFTIVLCELKALLESGYSLHGVRDKAALLQAASSG
jgi:uncharacterized protein YndB with AHSA1/START domain